MSTPTSFVIHRSNWLRGKKSTNSFLWNGQSHHSMCCLGQIAEQCGVSKEDLRYHPSPSALEKQDRLLLPAFLLAEIDGLGGLDSDACRLLMITNDDSHKTDANREELIIHKFAQHGYTVTFEDEDN